MSLLSARRIKRRTISNLLRLLTSTLLLGQLLGLGVAVDLLGLLGVLSEQVYSTANIQQLLL